MYKDYVSVMNRSVTGNSQSMKSCTGMMKRLLHSQLKHSSSCFSFITSRTTFVPKALDYALFCKVSFCVLQVHFFLCLYDYCFSCRFNCSNLFLNTLVSSLLAKKA